MPVSLVLGGHADHADDRTDRPAVGHYSVDVGFLSSGRSRRAMEEFARELSRRSNQPIWGWIDSKPAPSLTIDRGGPERVLVTIQDDAFVLFLDDGAAGSIPARQTLGRIGEAVDMLPPRFVDTLRAYGRELQRRGNPRFRRFIEFDMLVAETFSDGEGEREALLILAKDAYDNPPDNPTTLNGLVSRADAFGALRLKALLRATQGRSTLAIVKRGDDNRFTYSGARSYFELALEIVDTIPEGYESLRNSINSTLRTEFP